MTALLAEIRKEVEEADACNCWKSRILALLDKAAQPAGDVEFKNNSVLTDVKVRHLIGELQKFDPELSVVFHDQDSSCMQYMALDVDGTCSEKEPEVLRMTLTDDPEEPME